MSELPDLVTGRHAVTMTPFGNGSGLEPGAGLQERRGASGPPRGRQHA
jgi:hypothetical protein